MCRSINKKIHYNILEIVVETLNVKVRRYDYFNKGLYVPLPLTIFQSCQMFFVQSMAFMRIFVPITVMWLFPFFYYLYGHLHISVNSALFL